MPDDKQAIQETASGIAEALGETDRHVLRQIRDIIRFCGIDFAHQLLQDTQDIEAGDGLMTQDGKRRRTMAGVFFYLAKGRVSKEIRHTIWRGFGKKKKKQADVQ